MTAQRYISMAITITSEVNMTAQRYVVMAITITSEVNMTAQRSSGSLCGCSRVSCNMVRNLPNLCVAMCARIGVCVCVLYACVGGGMRACMRAGRVDAQPRD